MLSISFICMYRYPKFGVKHVGLEVRCGLECLCLLGKSKSATTEVEMAAILSTLC